ncbi:MAG: hypothetical protein ABJG80_02345 [Paracoccaceae bacterium]
MIVKTASKGEVFQMVMAPHFGSGPEPQKPSRFPAAYTVLFALVVAMAALTWIVPAGEYERVANTALSKNVSVHHLHGR